jgi:hypothetical protein
MKAIVAGCIGPGLLNDRRAVEQFHGGRDNQRTERISDGSAQAAVLGANGG